MVEVLAEDAEEQQTQFLAETIDFSPLDAAHVSERPPAPAPATRPKPRTRGLAEGL